MRSVCVRSRIHRLGRRESGRQYPRGRQPDSLGDHRRESIRLSRAIRASDEEASRTDTNMIAPRPHGRRSTVLVRVTDRHRCLVLETETIIQNYYIAIAGPKNEEDEGSFTTHVPPTIMADDPRPSRYFGHLTSGHGRVTRLTVRAGNAGRLVTCYSSTTGPRTTSLVGSACASSAATAT